MISHVVLFKLKEFETPEEKQMVLNELKSKLMNLENLINELKFIEVGKNLTIDSPSFDLCLITHFNSIDDLEKYKVNPEHLKVFEFIKNVTVDRAAVDFKF